MSESYYPTLPGLAYDVLKTPQWSTVVQASGGGYELRYGLWQTPLYRYTLTYEFLQNTASAQELSALLGFFLARQGRYDTFRFVDPTWNDPPSAFGVSLYMGTGDGVTTNFPLVRQIGPYTEPIRLYEPAMGVRVNGAYASLLGIGGGVLMLQTAPPAGASVVWEGLPYRRVRFDVDGQEFSQWAATLWDAKQVVLQEVR